MHRHLLQIIIINILLSSFLFGSVDGRSDGEGRIPDQPLSDTTYSTFLPLIMTQASGSNTLLGGQGIYIPYHGSDYRFSETAVFWFGTVNPNTNYVDVRIAYTSTNLVIYLAVFDRRIWYDESPTSDTLMDWDAASLYLDTSGTDEKTTLDSQTYRFQAQFNQQANPGYPNAYLRTSRGNGTGWTDASIPITAMPGWKGDALNNDIDDKGWAMTYSIPFSSLGFSSAPEEGQIWRLAVQVHDRNDANHSMDIPLTKWPDNASFTAPATWGAIRFGLPEYNPESVMSTSQTTIRQGLNNASVPSAEVGGGGTCGGDPSTYWTVWGNSVTAEEDRGDFNVQNQSDISDWPCFSKAFMTFPLTQIPSGKIIVSAELTLHQYGNSEPSEAQPSLVQIFRISEDWDEDTITWNNAPQVLENISQSWVDPLPGFSGWPGIERTWDVSLGVSEAYEEGEPLRLAIYEADSDYHSGKYFVSSEVEDWLVEGRPTLIVTWGNP